ncbi:transposase, partial [Bifidobacterium adolescentis]
MSQKVRIDGVKHVGASVFLGVDHCGNPRWTRNPERVMVWLCDGWRTRFNQRREQRTHNIPVKDDVTGEVVDWLKEPLGGPDVAELLPDKEARLQCSWMAGIPAPILSSTDRIENTEWSAGLKRKKTVGGRVPGFKSRHRGLNFVCWRNKDKAGNAIFHKTGRKSGVVVITGMNPKQWVKPGEKAHWRIVIHVRASQPIRPYTSVHVDWTHRSLVFVNMPLPLPRTGDGVIGLDRGCVHTLALSDGIFMDMPKPSKAELKRLKYLQRKMARQDRANEAKGGKTAKLASKRRRKTLNQFNALQGRIVRRRNDWIEKTTTRLAQESVLIAMEDLDVKAMTRRPKP